ncbi:glycosyltransferase [Actinomycetaceae bacterium L2_0104]
MTSVLMYSHDTVGLGHARRNRALAFALAQGLPELTGTPVGGLLVAGNPYAASDPLPAGWDWFILPGMTHAGRGHVPRHLDASAGAVSQFRSLSIRAAASTLQPDLFIVDRHPWGISHELEGTLRQLHANGCAIVLGLREVIDQPEQAAAEWERLGNPERLGAVFDDVWLYGDPAVHDARTTGELPAVLANMAHATGYLSRGRPRDVGTPAEHRPYVLTLMGGGSDGYALARIAAAVRVPAGFDHILITGPQMPDPEVEDLERRAGAGPAAPRIRRSAPNIPALIGDASAVVSMCGYNTATEILASTTPALIVPRSTRRTEQLLRAEALERADAVDLVRLENLDATMLERWIASAVTRRVRRDHIDLDGLHSVPALAASLLRQKKTHMKGELASVT